MDIKINLIQQQIINYVGMVLVWFGLVWNIGL